MNRMYLIIKSKGEKNGLDIATIAKDFMNDDDGSNITKSFHIVVCEPLLNIVEELKLRKADYLKRKLPEARANALRAINWPNPTSNEGYDLTKYGQLLQTDSISSQFTVFNVKTLLAYDIPEIDIEEYHVVIVDYI